MKPLRINHQVFLQHISFAYFRSSRDGFPLYATARNAIRAVCIADVLFQRLGEKGVEVQINFDDREGTTMNAIKDGATTQFYFREPYKKVTRTPALSKIEKQLHNYAWGSAQIEVPQNVLCINFGWRSYTKKSFKDTGLKLEYQIENIVSYVVKVLDEQIEESKQREICARENKRKKYISEFNERIAKSQENQLEYALKESKDLENLIRLKAYLKTMKEIFSKLPPEEKVAGLTWIKLVKTELKTIQPIETRIKRIKRAAKNPTKKIKELWYVDPLPEDYEPGFKAIYAEERRH